ncbi:MAG: phosphoribosylformylglycinamidine synthase subunit PurS [Polyangiales bacterium]
MRARVFVTLKREVLDPQGEAVRKGLQSLGVAGVREVRVGKLIELELDDAQGDADAALRTAVEKLLVNPVIEDGRVEVLEAKSDPAR